MKLKIAIFIAIAELALANNLRRKGEEAPESRQLQTWIYGYGSKADKDNYGGSRRRSNDVALIIVEDDDSDETQDCSAATADEFDRDFDVILFEADDSDAQDGDIVAVINEYTDCDDLMDEIEKELGNRHSETTVYVYYGDGRRYYKKNKGYRLWWGGGKRKDSYGYWYGYGGRRKYWKNWDDKKDHKDDRKDDPRPKTEKATPPTTAP